MLTSLILFGGLLAGSPQSATANLESSDLPISYARYSTVDKFKRKITFYVSKAQGEAKLPVALMILGSGGQSAFMKRGDKVYGGLQSILLSRAKDKFRVVVVEKPGVEFCFDPPQPGSAVKCSKEFLEEHTLERWAEANRAALDASGTITGVSSGKGLVVGHSEGGIVAAKVGNLTKNASHIAILAGGGPNQLVDLKETMGSGVDEEWAKIKADPMSTEKFAWGHPYRRWSTFLSTSVIEEVAKGTYKVFLASGTKDQAVPVSGFHVAVKELKAKGRKFDSLLVDGADHGFAKPEDQGKPDGLFKVMDAVLAWYEKA